VILYSAGCDGSQSSLAPAGRGAQQIAELFWLMTIGTAVIWTAVMLLAFYSARVSAGKKGRRAGWLIIGGGALIPTVVLAALLIYGLGMLPDMLSPARDGSLTVKVTGEQWWWRVRYVSPAGEPIDLANEIRLPVGEPVEFHLDSADVIHSFWVPSLGGKVDMFPGRQTRLKLEPTQTGVFLGACAEYCGTSHALMQFVVVVSDKAEFNSWLEREAAPASSPRDPTAVRGEKVFVSSGCGACHSVRGTTAQGVVGPDLTHVGSRKSLGAGILPNGTEDFWRWLTRNDHIKPEVHMPRFDMLPNEDLRALAAYLDSLE
jgi:cytochrome c oxidase subunit 2